MPRLQREGRKIWRTMRCGEGTSPVCWASASCHEDTMHCLLGGRRDLTLPAVRARCHTRKWPSRRCPLEFPEPGIHYVFPDRPFPFEACTVHRR